MNIAAHRWLVLAGVSLAIASGSAARAETPAETAAAFGPQRNTGEVVRAALTAGGIDLVVFFPASAQSRQITLAKTADGRLRIITDAFITTKEYAIRDGKLLSTGTDMPWQMRCR